MRPWPKPSPELLRAVARNTRATFCIFWAFCASSVPLILHLTQNMGCWGTEDSFRGTLFQNFPCRGHLRDEGRGGGRLVLPDGRELLGALVVARQAVNARLDEDEAELGVLVLAVALEVLAHGDGLLDEVVEVLRELRREAVLLEKAEDGAAGDGLHLGNAVGVTEDDADLRRGEALLGELADERIDIVGSDLEPRRRRALVREGRAGLSLSVRV